MSETVKPSLTPEDNSSEKRIAGEPRINVIGKEEYEARVEKVFHMLWEVLARSFGPYGAPTLICNYPWTHVTKDGYTIMKNLSMDTSKTMVDQQIADMAADICGRLNYSVGDGTTSAVIATNSIYQQYRKAKAQLEKMHILPRDVIKKYNALKTEIIKTLETYVTKVNVDDREALAEIIRNVVYISSNGDDQITEYIADLYRELGCPAITCSLAPDGITKKTVINGYKFDMSLMDRLYINSDDDVMHLDSADIIIFSTKVKEVTYEKILKPLNEACRLRGRRLVVAAPNYDERTLSQTIRRDLNNEWAKTKKINMVLTTYRASSEHARKLVEDFAVLINTLVIDRALEQRLIEDIEKVSCVENVLNIDSRDNLPDINVAVVLGTADPFTEGNPLKITKTVNGKVDVPYMKIVPVIDDYLRIGYAEDLDIGLKSTVVRGLYYNESTYEAILKEAKKNLDDSRKKYQKLGTFNLAVTQAEQRYYALNLKMGSIEVGADSELSQKMLKDAVDDSIKAAASAYYHGVVCGDNVTLIRSIGEILYKNNNGPESDHKLLRILYRGFKDVYRTVLSNAFPDTYIDAKDLDIRTTEAAIRSITKYLPSRDGAIYQFEEDDRNVRLALREIIDDEVWFNHRGKISIHDFIIQYSILTKKAFDLSTMSFSEDIINSAQTDIEILKATIDLITILIVGNQMVVTQKHNFE